MRVRQHRDGHESAGGGGGAHAGDAGNAGKRSMTAGLGGGAGAGEPLHPGVNALMSSAFNTDFSSVRVHEGPQAQSVGALAYAQGTDLHFAPGQYQPESERGRELIGHELAHVVQQAQGRVSAPAQAKASGAVNHDSSLEREADDMGARAARGERVNSTEVSVGPGVTIQCYLDQTIAGKPWRVADNLDMAIRQDSPVYGSHHFYAEAALIGTANGQLDATGSRLALKAGSGSMSVTDGKVTKSLARVSPENKKDGTKGNATSGGMQWPDDCGLAANAVMQGDNLKGKAVYSTPPTGWFEQIIAYFTGSTSVEREGPAREYGTDTDTHRGETMHTPHMMLDDILKATLDKDPAKAWTKYQSMDPADREAFDKKVGINKYASPEVGEAFSIVSNKDELVDGKSAWNFHWGGVVMKSGGDHVTMENFAGSGEDAWDFQMYGSANKAGQTFHEQQEIRTHHASGQDEYGQNPTTIRVRPE